jgi:hypothetical protein
MIPEIKELHSPDIYDLISYEPFPEDSFCFLVQLIAGPQGQEGEESFDVMICSPKWIMENVKEDEPLIGRHYLIMKKYNFDLLWYTIQSYCKLCEGKIWIECAEKLSRLGKWEFEDYRE